MNYFCKLSLTDVSTDGETWNIAKEIKTGKGGTETIEFTSAPARYVRIYAYKRHTGYGNSIYELGVYGTEQLTTSAKTLEAESEEVEVFTAEGYMIGRFNTAKAAAESLQPGIYLTRRNGNVQKVVVSH